MFKKFLSLIVLLAVLLNSLAVLALAKPLVEPVAEPVVYPHTLDFSNTVPTAEILIGDPFILVYDNKYFMYGTDAVPGLGYGCYVSLDLENWVGPYYVFEAPDGFDGVNCFWAPECHYYKGAFYLFASYASLSTGHRGVSVFKAGNPLGPFEEISDGHITPHDWDSIDGTLYIDPAGDPWMVFVHEWTSLPDYVGTMSAARLSDDFSSFITEPFDLFKATAPLWSLTGITDGPFLYEGKNGGLFMLWSTFDSNWLYCVTTACSPTGRLDALWLQDIRPIYSYGRYFENEGGHAMLFTDLEGRLMMCLHSPNYVNEDAHKSAIFLEVKDRGYKLEIQKIKEIRAGQNKFKLFIEDIREWAKYIETVFNNRLNRLREKLARL